APVRCSDVTAGSHALCEADVSMADPINWDEAVRAYHPRGVASLLALRIPFDRAGEIASPTGTRLIGQHPPGGPSPVKLPGPAIRQARFLALTGLRASRNDADLDDELAAADADPERALIARRDVETALRVLAGCSPSARAVVELVYEEPPLAHAAVAARVGL